LPKSFELQLSRKRSRYIYATTAQHCPPTTRMNFC
jgi:hypothetical protein